MNKRKIIKMFFILLLCSFFLVSCGSSSTESQNIQEKKEGERDKKQEEVPTLFIHGYKGGKTSFGSMIYRLSSKNIGTKSIRLIVTPDGTIKEEGKWKEGKNPLIQVIFEDNTNDEWRQSEWIASILEYLQIEHEVEKVQLVGHSMGGVSSLRYLTSDMQEGVSMKIVKFVAIGAPFNEFVEDEKSVSEIQTTGPTTRSPRFEEYQANFTKYPRDCAFLNIAGDVEADNKSDGIVPVPSVEAINFLFETNSLPYTYEQVTGKKAEHSALHENTQVDKIVSDFLWQ